MGLLGNAVVAIWNDIVPEARAEYIEWHNREHMPERVEIPGFIRGRRYVARTGSPEYFTLYETTGVDVLTGPDYTQRLNNPTPWTLKSITSFRNLARGLCEVAFSNSYGDGAYLVTLRFDVSAAMQEQIKRELIENILPRLLTSRGITGVHLCLTNRMTSSVEAAEKRGMDNTIPNWIVLIEASLAASAENAAQNILKHDALADGIEGGEHGVYLLEINREKETKGT